MIEDLKSYPKYKDSGLPWLGSIPHHWDCLPHRAIFKEIKEQGYVNEALLSVTIGRGIIRQKDLLAESSKKDSSNLDKSKYKLVEPGDIAYNKMRAWQGAMGVSKYRGIVSPAYIVQRLRCELRPEYFHYLFRTPSFAKEAERWSYGITSDQWSLRPQHFKMIYSCVPPLGEQELIIGFLSNLDRKIRRFMHYRRRMIELLNEQKQTIINRVVRRGIDANVKMKDFGMQWLGNVPEHWEVIKLSRVISEGPKNGISPPVDENGTIESFSISAIRDGRVNVRDKDKKFIGGMGIDLINSYSLKEGDILLVRGNGNIHLVGKTGLVEEDMPDCVYPDLLMRLRMNRRCSPLFFVLLMNSEIARDQIETAARTAVGTFKINNQQVRQFHFAFPPLPEQQKIIRWLDDELKRINALLNKAGNEISLIHEYHTRLISDVVTGKIDVRHLAPPANSEDMVEVAEALEPLIDVMVAVGMDDNEDFNESD